MLNKDIISSAALSSGVNSDNESQTKSPKKPEENKEPVRNSIVSVEEV